MVRLLYSMISSVENVAGGAVNATLNVVGGSIYTAKLIVNGTLQAVHVVVGGVSKAADTEEKEKEKAGLNGFEDSDEDSDDDKTLTNETVGTDSGKWVVREFLRHSTKLLSPELILIAAKELISTTFRPQVITGPVQELLGHVVESTAHLISLAGPDSLVKAGKTLTTAVLRALIDKVGHLEVVKDGIFGNQLNKVTLRFIWSNGAEIAKFIIDIVETAKCYALSDSQDGIALTGEPHGTDNEFDFSEPMNRHALVSQFQRLMKSIIFILSHSTSKTDFEDIDMSYYTTLKSDCSTSGDIITVSPPTIDDTTDEKPAENPPAISNEKWLFVNGIAGELYWLRLACKKLANKYSREVTGVFNRGDGVLWDLIECAGERSAAGSARGGQKKSIPRTESSTKAQKRLKKQLEEALNDPKIDRVVMVAHSQGCLILRLALAELVIEKGPAFRKAMLDRLCVFTFGSPSIHWMLDHDERNSIIPLMDSEKECPTEEMFYLRSHVLHTEHFANKVDFVATLGVLNDNNPAVRGYFEEDIFINSEDDWIGHLFGTQYSFDPSNYKNSKGEPTGKHSWLLNCEKSRNMRGL